MSRAMSIPPTNSNNSQGVGAWLYTPGLPVLTNGCLRPQTILSSIQQQSPEAEKHTTCPRTPDQADDYR